MRPDSELLRILQDIQATRPVSDEDANRAVREGHAVQAEDGDIDLTQKGRQLIDSTRL